MLFAVGSIRVHATSCQERYVYIYIYIHIFTYIYICMCRPLRFRFSFYHPAQPWETIRTRHHLRLFVFASDDADCPLEDVRAEACGQHHRY